MGSYIGNNIKVSVWGQSHSPAIGVTVDGFLPGETVDMEELSRFLARRAPGQGPWATARKEADAPQFLSGLVENTTCGAPLTAMIENTNTRSGDYASLKDVPRPGHSDYAAQMKYHGFQDVAGGGHFSGRLTAPLCIAGGICLQILRRRGIHIAAHIASIGSVQDTEMNLCAVDADVYSVAGKAFPTLSEAQGEAMQEVIANAKKDCDSVGGVVECMVTGMPAGVGEPMFGGVENRLAAALFGIPAVKGLEFGNGFACAQMRGSENNDSFYMEEKDGSSTVRTRTNHHGGALGGITSGMPIVFRLAIKPTPSIAKEQDSIRFSTGTEEKLQIIGRHDPCIVPRAVPVVEAVAALVVYDMLLDA